MGKKWWEEDAVVGQQDVMSAIGTKSATEDEGNWWEEDVAFRADTGAQAVLSSIEADKKRQDEQARLHEAHQSIERWGEVPTVASQIVMDTAAIGERVLGMGERADQVVRDSATLDQAMRERDAAQWRTEEDPEGMSTLEQVGQYIPWIKQGIRGAARSLGSAVLGAKGGGALLNTGKIATGAVRGAAAGAAVRGAAGVARGASQGAGGAARAALASPGSSAYGAIGLASTQETNRAITEGADAGLKGAALAGYVASQGIIEALPATVMQRLGLGGVEAMIAGPSIRGGIKAGFIEAIKATGQEIPEELATEVLHAVANEYSGVDTQALSGDSLSSLVADTVLQTVIMGAGAGALKTATGEAQARLARLQEIRAKGFVSAEEAKELGIVGKNRNERRANADAEIEQLSAIPPELPPEVTQATPPGTPPPLPGVPGAAAVPPTLPPPLPQGAANASQVPTNEGSPNAQGNGGEGSQVPVSSQVRGAGQDQGSSQPTRQEPAAQEVQVKPPRMRDDEPPVAEGMTRLYHGSATPGRTEGKAWFSTSRPYAENYRGKETSELQYVDVPTEMVNKNVDPDNYGQTVDKGFVWNVELDSSETGPRKIIAKPQAKPVDPVSELDQAEDEFGELAKTFDDEEETAPSTPVPPQEQKPASTKPVVQPAQSRDELIAKRDALQAEAKNELSIDRAFDLEDQVAALNKQINATPAVSEQDQAEDEFANLAKTFEEEEETPQTKPVEQPKPKAEKAQEPPSKPEWDVVKGGDGKLYREDPNAKTPSERIKTRQAIDPSEGAAVITKDQWGKPIPPETLKARQEFADKAKPGVEFEASNYKGQSFKVLDDGTLLNSSATNQGRKLGNVQDMVNTIVPGQITWKESPSTAAESQGTRATPTTEAPAAQTSNAAPPKPTETTTPPKQPESASAQPPTPPKLGTKGVIKPARKMEPTEEGRPVDGKPIIPGDRFVTNTGRETTPYPKYSGSSNRQSINADKKAQLWLIENAIAEAESRGDDFNLTTFKSELENARKGKLPQASKDSATLYVFGDYVPAVPKPILKPLIEKPSENSKNDTARTDKSSELDSKPVSQPEGVGSSATNTGAALPASEQARENLRKRGKKKPSQADIDAETSAVIREREADNKVRQEFQSDRDAQKAQDARREFVGKQKELANPATVDSLGFGDIAQVNDDIERGRVSYEDATKVADEFVAAGYLPQGKRDQIRKPTQPSADQVNVDSGEDSKVKPEDELASLRAKSEKMYDEVERLQNTGKDREANALLREAEKLTPRIKELEAPLIKAKQDAEVAAKEESRKAYNAKEDARKAALPTKQTRNGWELATDGARWYLRDPNTKEIIYEGKLKRVREVADESPPDVPASTEPPKSSVAPDKAKETTEAEAKPSESVPPLPWSNSSPEDESKWYGTKINVAPANRREEPYTGQVVRVLNRGEMVEVQPDGQDGTFRVDSARITLAEAAPTVADKPSVEPAAEPLPDPAIPAFTRTTPGKGSATRQFQSERVEKARKEIADLERKARAKRSEHDGLRSNATKKRAAVKKEIYAINNRIQVVQGEIASDFAADTLAKLEDELESPRSYDHYLAGMKAIHKLKASVAEDAARRGEMGREAARAEVSKEQNEADRLDAELQGRAKDIAMSKGFTPGDADQIALSASNGFTVFEDRSLADIVEVQGARTRESRVSQEINKLKPSSPYGQQDLSTEQIAEFTKQYQEASLDDKNWLDKRKEVDKSVREAIQANRDAVRKREDEERKAKEAEKAKDDQERLANARERAKKYFLDERISKALKKQKPKTKPVKLRQEKAGGPVKIVDGKITDGDQSGELYPNGLILHKSFEEGSKDFVLTHARSGSGFPFSAKKSDMQELIGIIDLLGIDFNVDTDEKGALPSELTARVKKINNAWDNNDYSLLSDEDYATVQTLAETAKTDIDADLILTADDLGANGIPPGLDNVMTDKGLRIVKEMAIAVPEFAYDPVFTVKDGKLLYRDGFEFKLEPTAFNLHPSELQEGQTVGINLDDLGIKRSTPQDVVAEMMKQAGIPRVTKGKGGDVSVGYVGSIPTSLQQAGDDNEWDVVSGTPKVREIAIATLKKIRWRQPGQDGDPKTDIDVVPADQPQATDSATVESKKFGTKASEAVAAADPQDIAGLLSQDRFVDSTGQEYLVNKSRSGVIVAHPIVDGKPVVNSDSAVMFAIDDNGKARNPEYRTDIASITKWENPNKPSEAVATVAPTSEPLAKTKLKKAAEKANQELAEEDGDDGEGDGTASLGGSIPTRQSRTARSKAEGEKAGIAAADIQKTAERLFKVPIRQGGFNQRAAGIYKWITRRNTPPSPEVIRTAEDHYANLAVIAHEIAHHIDEMTKAVRSMPKAVKDEVSKLDYQPEKGRAFEGWAEFLRRYMTEPPIDVNGTMVPNPGIDAPQTLAWFEGTFLQANADVGKAITEFRKYAQQFAQQSVFQRVSTLIADRQPHDLSFKERWLSKSKRWLHRLKTMFVDKFHTLEWIQEEANRRGRKGVGIYDLTMAYFMSATSHATIAFEEGVRNLQTGKPIGTTTLWGLREHLKSDGEYQDATLYALARHTVFMADKKPGYNTGMDIEDAEAWIAEVEANNQTERFENFAKDLAQFNNDLLEMLVQAGALAPSDAATILDYYGGKNYFPLHRAKDGGMFTGTGVGFVNLGKAVRRRTQSGSGQQIIDPVDATVAQAIRYYGRAIQARQQHVLAETLDPKRGGVGGMGGLMDRVDPKRVVHRGTIKEILGTLVEEGVVEADDAKAMRIASAILDGEGMVSQDSLEWFAERHGIEIDDELAIVDAAKSEPNALAFISLWRPDYTPNATKRTVMIYDKNGEPLMYELDPDLYSTATGMEDVQFSGFMSTLREASRYFKSGAVGLSTGFGTANLLRDYWEFQGKARHTKGMNSLGKPPEMLGRYIAAKAKRLTGAKKADDALVRLYEETGGKVYSVVGHDVHGQKMYRRRRLGKTTMSRMGVSLSRPLDTAERGLQAVQELIAISDAPPRMADAEAAIKEEGYERRQDKWYDLNSGQLVDQLPEHVRIKAAVAMSEATINFKRIGSKGQYVEAFMPFFNATVQAMYRQYKQVKGLKSVGRKDAEGMQAKRYLVYLSALASTAVFYWMLRNDDDDWREQDSYLRDGFWTWGKNGKTYVRIPKPRDSAVVSNVVENMLDSWYHDDARPLPELLLRDFGGRLPTGGGLARGVIEAYIADYDYFRERDLTPYNMQKMPKELQVTSYTSRVSDTIGKVTGRYLNTSPIQVEHLLSSASGGLYHRMTELYEAADEGRIGPEHYPFVRAIFIDRHQARSVNDFYDKLEETDEASELEKAAEGVVSDATTGKLAVLEAHAELMTTIRNMEGRKGKRREYEYQQYIVGIARQSLGYKALANNPNPLSDKDIPQPIADVIQDYKGRVVVQASETLKKLSEYKNKEDYEDQRKTIVRGKAKLQSLGLNLVESKKLLEAYWKSRGWKVKKDNLYVDAIRTRFKELEKLFSAK